MQYEIVGTEKELLVEGDTWLAALGHALEAMGLGMGAITRMEIEVGRGGEVEVKDPAHGTHFKMLPIESLFDPSATPISIDEVVFAEIDPSPPLGDEQQDLPTEEMGGVPDLPTLPLRPENLDTRLSSLSSAFKHLADFDQACAVAMEILRHMVGAESGAVLEVLGEGHELVFRAVYGPKSRRLIGTRIGASTGVAGFSYQLAADLVVNHALVDVRHDKSIDMRLGYTTFNVLATPLIRDDGFRFGCLELINAPAGFAHWHLDAARTIATYLSRRYIRPD